MKKGLENAEAMKQFADINYREREDYALRKAQELLNGKVARKIHQAASIGEYSTHYTCYDEAVHHHLVKLLRENGYKAVIPLAYDYILISWS